MKSKKLSLLMCVSGSVKSKRGQNYTDCEEDLNDSSISTESLAYVQSILLNNVQHEKNDDSKGLLTKRDDECNNMSTWSETIAEPAADDLKDEHESYTERTHFSTPISFASLDEIHSDVSFTEIAENNRFSFGDDSRDVMTELESEVDTSTKSMTSAVDYMMSMKQLTETHDESLSNIEFSSFDNVAGYISSMEF